MTSKTTLSLIEQVIMVLVFSIATAICLRIFVYSNNLSEENRIRDVAVSEVRNAAEVLKATHGNVDQALKTVSHESDGLSLDIDLLPSDLGYLGKARVFVSDSEGEIYSLVVSWQEDLAS